MNYDRGIEIAKEEFVAVFGFELEHFHWTPGTDPTEERFRQSIRASFTDMRDGKLIPPSAEMRPDSPEVAALRKRLQVNPSHATDQEEVNE